MRTLTAIALLLILAPLAACQSGKPAEAPVKKAGFEVLPNLPLPPGGTPLTSQSSAEAMQVIATTESPVDSVVAYYRDLLARPPFRLINETMADSITSFYVEQEGPSLWITVQRNGPAGSLVVIAGAAADTSAAGRAAAKAANPSAAQPTGKKPN